MQKSGTCQAARCTLVSLLALNLANLRLSGFDINFSKEESLFLFAYKCGVHMLSVYIQDAAYGHGTDPQGLHVWAESCCGTGELAW